MIVVLQMTWQLGFLEIKIGLLKLVEGTRVLEDAKVKGARKQKLEDLEKVSAVGHISYVLSDRMIN